MTAILTRREAHCVLGLLAAGGAVTTSAALAEVLDIPQASVQSSLRAVDHRLGASRKRAAVIEHKPGFGWVLYGHGNALEALFREASQFIARDAATLAADAKAGRIIARPQATSSQYLGLGG